MHTLRRLSYFVGALGVQACLACSGGGGGAGTSTATGGFFSNAAGSGTASGTTGGASGSSEATTGAGTGGTESATGSGGASGAATGAATGASTCPSGLTLCDSTCVSLATDGHNCGKCGNSCDLAKQKCTGGKCVGTSTTGGSTGTATTGATTGGPTCTDSAHPVLCPALGNVPEECWSAGTICSTVTNCGGTYHACTSAGSHLDCTTMKCVSSGTTGGTGGTSGATTGATTGGTTGPMTPAKATCTYAQTYTSLQSPGCTCTATAGTSPATYAGRPCGEGGGSLCCASPGYPGSGGDCNCYATDVGPWACETVTAQVCECGFQKLTNSTPTSTCNDVPGSDGVPWVCCFDQGSADPYGAGCLCEESATIKCGGTTTQVADCANATALRVQQPQARTECPSGTMQVTQCSQNLTGTCISNDDCEGGCTAGVGFVCCSICSNSHCVESCQ